MDDDLKIQRALLRIFFILLWVMFVMSGTNQSSQASWQSSKESKWFRPEGAGPPKVLWVHLPRVGL